MNSQEAVNQAILFCERNQGSHFQDPAKETGIFEILDDLNCCAPTNTVLFSFQKENSRKVMSAEELLDFAKTCTRID